MLNIQIPGREELILSHLILDYNGTIAEDGEIIESIRPRLEALAKDLAIYVITADTHGTAAKKCEGLPLQVLTFPTTEVGLIKAQEAQKLSGGVITIGNGFNDIQMSDAADLSICAPLTSGDTIRDMIPEGGIPMRLLYQLYVFENWLYRVNMTGDQLRLWMEHSAKNYTSDWNPGYFGAGYYTDEIYGLYYEIHYYAPEGQRIQNMQYKGQPVAPDQVFTVAMNNYRFTGGAGFMQAAGLTPEDYSLTDLYTGDTLGNDNGQVRNIVAQYIRDQKVIEPTVESTWKFFMTKEDAIAAGATVVE